VQSLALYGHQHSGAFIVPHGAENIFDQGLVLQFPGNSILFRPEYFGQFTDAVAKEPKPGSIYGLGSIGAALTPA
jgi:hypothetical protein